nr:MAG: polyprotein [Picornavirales sp.]
MIYGKQPRLDSLPMQLEMDYSRILNKPYFVKSVNWRMTDSINTTLSRLLIPEDILLNELAKIPFRASVYYRAKVTAIVQTAGTPMHQGCVMVSAIPIGYKNYDNDPSLIRNTLMCCPHAFLLANEATPATIEIPFYVQSKLAAIDLEGTTVSPNSLFDNYSELVFYVWNPLAGPSTASSELTISVHFMFTELEFYVPHVDVKWTPLDPGFQAQGFFDDIKKSTSRAIDGLFSTGRRFTGDLLDNLRSGIKSWTGLHNPDHVLLSTRSAVQFRQNLNTVDGPNYMEKMDPFSDFTHITNDFTFDTDIDEMSLAHILKKPQFIGSFSVKSRDTTGSLLWSRPITPIQEIRSFKYNDYNDKTTHSNLHTNNIQTLAYLSKYWKGSMKIHIQAVMSNFHYCRLIVARDYSPDTNMETSYPTYESVTNLLTETLEFSAGGQVQTIELPYCSLLNQLPCSSDFVFNALQHGVYYVYLYQPLVSNGSVAEDINFNVYLSCGDDFDYFGYAVQPLMTYNSFSGGAPPFGRFEAQASVTVDVSNQAAITNTGDTQDIDTLYDLRPVKSIRDYTRRMIKQYSNAISKEDFVKTNGTFTIPVSRLLGMEPYISGPTETQSVEPSLTILSRMFMGYSGGVKVKLVVNGSPISEVWYVPPSYSLSVGKNYWMGNKPQPNPGDIIFEDINEMYMFPDANGPVKKYSNWYNIQTVAVERPNYINSDMGTYKMKIEEATGKRVPMSSTVTEFVIPYMSPYRFLGDYTKMGTVTNTSLQSLATHDMGHIVFKIAAPLYEIGSGGAYAEENVCIEYYAGIADEGRFGYQISAPPVLIPSVAIGNGSTEAYYQLTPSWNSAIQAPPFSTVVSPSAGLYSIEACYYSAT